MSNHDKLQQFRGTEMEERIIRLKDVVKQVGLSASTISRLRESNDFPKPVKLTPRIIGWKLTEINEWLESKDRLMH